MTYQRDFERRIRLGVVGVGNHSYRNILPALHYLPVTLVAVCDINEELARKTASEFGCAAYTSTARMYEGEELEGVILCVSPQMHPRLAIEAFQAGLHVWMEKPVGLRVHDVEEMLSHRRDRVAVAGFKKAFMPAADKAIETVQSPDYGNLQSILAVYPMTLPDNGEEVLANGTYVNWLANGVHPLSFLLAVGGEAAELIAHRNRNGAGLCMIEFASGVIGNFHFASGPHPNECYRLFGPDWHMTIDAHRIALERGIPMDYIRTHHYAPAGFESGAIVWETQNCLLTLENKAIFTQGVYGELKYFCDCILEGRQAVRGSLEFALHLMKVYEAALRSNGRFITIS